MRLLSLIAVAVVVLLGTGPAPAQAPSAEALTAARELVIASKATDRMKEVLPMLMQALKPAIAQGRPVVEKEYDRVLPLVMAIMAERMNELVDSIAQIYARNFSAAELRDISAFYRTSTGQKLIEKLPGVMQESLVTGQKFGEALAVEFQERMADELRKRGHDIKL